ncbi:aldehyde dehydrogenase family protein [Nitrosospira sp. NRS527]|uniref:aldehyde dehydrogenase family protein n=1 Tax=Nitrosospira sp. NRS527 TaxID=155925 RepID=UPI001AF61BDE|nr:aldehyde dehydrogenase family protein [Nitrosospira sp. NRS527]BCT67709.1 4-hydroxybenzaldehyde dehydrogenase (NADP(+)) [Nitrosospira sp. NRS527]
MYLSYRSIGSALALGNGVAIKPTEDTLVTVRLPIARIYEEAGLPPGLPNVIIGDVKEIAET